MSEITIPLVFFIILCFSLVGVIITYICERIDKTVKARLDLENERYKILLEKKEIFKGIALDKIEKYINEFINYKK